MNSATPSAIDVPYLHALEWFSNRDHIYIKLAEVVKPYLQHDSVLFDIGANIGYFTYMLTKHTSFRGTAYLFEPMEHLAGLCEITMSSSPCAAKILNYGLSDAESSETLYVGGANLGWNTVIQEKTNKNMKETIVKMKKFDECGIDAMPDLIKVDVEGAEYLVFKGMFNSLKNWHRLPVILCEIGWGDSHPYWQDELKVFKELKELGYESLSLAGTPIDISQITSTTDILLLPR